MSGTLGWRRKIKRRKEDGLDFYRSARSTLAGRCKKKLLEKTTWYKRKRDDDEEESEPNNSPNKRLRRDERSKHMDKYKNEAMTKEMKKNKNKENVKAVMFVPYTVGSILAKRMRKA